MSRKLLNLQNEAIANDPAAEARAADNADRELETELPELHTVLRRSCAGFKPRNGGPRGG